ncbi:hypothetical protein [Streptomyces sp. NBC_00199]|uniref:hypothetical protein n=1 Tax=Streptomyces sp. NBC_00199 TaxID=2975678 RepID=UPI00225773C7|nr:hypothetical protein [Streptomyces sp. NBC_00199]MCX5263997.1 hypothetical protein [Streptomyces sp. NBC_00199]
MDQELPGPAIVFEEGEVVGAEPVVGGVLGPFQRGVVQVAVDLDEIVDGERRGPETPRLLLRSVRLVDRGLRSVICRNPTPDAGVAPDLLSLNLFHPVLAGEKGWSVGVVTKQGPSSLAW